MDKNTKLKAERGVSFEDIILAIEDDETLLDIITHPNSKKYPQQKMYVVELYGYAYLVPFVRKENVIFLKTIIPSRKATKKYLSD